MIAIGRCAVTYKSSGLLLFVLVSFIVVSKIYTDRLGMKKTMRMHKRTDGALALICVIEGVKVVHWKLPGEQRYKLCKG